VQQTRQLGSQGQLLLPQTPQGCCYLLGPAALGQPPLLLLLLLCQGCCSCVCQVQHLGLLLLQEGPQVLWCRGCLAQLWLLLLLLHLQLYWAAASCICRAVVARPKWMFRC
jgi:hypothetical protein